MDDSHHAPPSFEQPKEMGITTKIVRYGSALRRGLAEGMPIRTDEDVRRIYDEICRPCEYYGMAKKNCRICGCRLSSTGMAVTNKIRMATERCPKEDGERITPMEFRTICTEWSSRDFSVVHKAWGTAEQLYADRHCEMSRLMLYQGGYSSYHLHQSKANAFLVLQGRLLVSWRQDNRQEHRLLGPEDEMFAVSAGVPHRFRAVESQTVVYEFCYSANGGPLDPDDIVRYDVGGVTPWE